MAYNEDKLQKYISKMLKIFLLLFLIKLCFIYFLNLQLQHLKKFLGQANQILATVQQLKQYQYPNLKFPIDFK
jgi:hypothetical protein